MSTSEIYFLSFLENINSRAAYNAKKMEELFFEDPSSSILKARIFAEEILNAIFLQEQIEAPPYSNMNDKITYLSREGYITREIQQIFDTIRLSGNKAAHDGEFNDITVAFKLHKEMYKLAVWFVEVYYLDHIKTIPPYDIPKQKANIKELVKNQLLKILDKGNVLGRLLDEERQKNESDEDPSPGTGEVKEKPEKSNEIILKNLAEGESYLKRELERLKDSSQEAIENASQFSKLKDYMHVDRKIQLDLEKILERNQNKASGNLILLCGSVGDGKSHLLAYLNEKKSTLINDYKIYNDATESFSPSKNAVETLEEVLYDFSDEKIDQSQEKVILAINTGVLHNFINADHKKYQYSKLKEFVEQSQLFSQNVITTFSMEKFDLLSFGDYHTFELTETGVKSRFYSSLVDKIFVPSDNNPFHLAYLEDQKNNVQTMVHENFKLLQHDFVRKQILNIIVETIVKQKLVISARAFLNFIADIVIPHEVKSLATLTQFEVLDAALPNLLFKRTERSTILQSIEVLDPIHRRSPHIDQISIELNTLNDWKPIIKENIKDETAVNWLRPFIDNNTITGYSFNLFFESFIRLNFLTNEQFSTNIAEKSYLEYIQNLYYFNTKDLQGIKNYYDEIKKSIFDWKGSPDRDYIFINKPSEKFRLAQKLNLNPKIDHLQTNENEELYSFKASLVLKYQAADKEVYLDVDYPLFSLLKKVRNGYRPNKKDEEDAIKFVEFIEKVMASGEKKEEMLVIFSKEDKAFKIKKGDFEAFVFERV